MLGTFNHKKALPMKNKLIIQLKNLPEKGEQFVFDKKSSNDLSSQLQDVIDKNDYFIKVEIHSTGDFTYLIKGHIKTNLNLLCSRCAYEFKYPIDKSFSENIYIQKNQKRRDKEVRINHYSEQSVEEDFTILNDTLFHLDDFIHELIAVEEPQRPVPYPECDQNDNCEHLQKVKKTGIFNEDSKSTALQEKLKSLLKE